MSNDGNGLAFHIITITSGDDVMATLYAKDGDNLLRVIQIAGLEIAAPCGGKSRCGKCLVRILTDLSSICPPSEAELSLIPPELYRAGYRLACFINIKCDLAISLALKSSTAKIITSGFEMSVELEPYICKYAVELKRQTLEDQVPDAEHVARSLFAQHPELSKKGLLPGDCANNNVKSRTGAQVDADVELGAQVDADVELGAHVDAHAKPDVHVDNINGTRAGGGNMKSLFGIVPGIYSDVRTLMDLPEIIGDVRDGVTCVCAGNRIAGVESGNTAARFFGAAFDIGTTTIAGYLYNLADGRQAAVTSSLNPQAKYGADVISRINHTISETGGLAEMRKCVVDEVDRLLSRMTVQAGTTREDVYAAYIVGNTTMLHLFAGFVPVKIAAAPFIPITTGLCVIPQEQSGLAFANSGSAVLLPGVSAYVGADTLAATLSCNMDISNEVNVLIDIGTNGEIVIGCKDYLYACSTAAGPAFEGANIRCGVGGVEGAIDAFQIRDGGVVEFTTIGGAKAIGICGSGLVDVVSELLGVGIVDETGRMIGADEARKEGVHPDLCERIVESEDGMRLFKLPTAEESSASGGIYVTQRDVRELQNAKASIAAGVRTLLKIAKVDAKNVRQVFLAGGFGSYIRVQSALNIGLVFNEFKGRVTPAGNAAGAGASAALLSEGASGRILKMSREMRYVELSSSPAFTEAYIDCMTFE